MISNLTVCDGDGVSSTFRIMFTVGNVDPYIDRYIGRHSIDIAVASRSTVDRVSCGDAVFVNFFCGAAVFAYRELD